MGILKHDPIDIRTCAFCKKQRHHVPTRRVPAVPLQHAAVRTPGCLLKAKGYERARRAATALVEGVPGAGGGASRSAWDAT